MSKYIVKNCPCLYEYGKGDCCNDLKYDQHTLCKACTDCLIKQVIEKCKKECAPTNNDWCRDKENLSREILHLFEIEECTDEN